MSNTKLLLNVASDLRSLADSVQAMATAMTGNDAEEAVQPETSTPTMEPKPEVKLVTLEQVRAALAEKSYDGFTAEVRELLEKHGAKKLSEIDPGEYQAILLEAEALK